MPASHRFPLLGWIAAAPAQAFAAFVALHAVVWTALPTLLYPNLPLDLIEALVYGREWQLGYDKLPPLPWWLVEIAYRIVGHRFRLLPAGAGGGGGGLRRYLCDGAAAGRPARRAGRRAHRRRPALPQLHRRQVQSRRRSSCRSGRWRALPSTARCAAAAWQHWLLLGLAVGLSFWAKYFVLVLALPLGLFMLIDRDARKSLATPGPYLALAAALIVMAPHLVWLVQNDFLPLAYAEHRAQPVARVDRPSLASVAIRGQPVVLSDSVAADRGAAVLAAHAQRHRRWR